MDDSETSFQRELGALERMRLWFPNINVVMAARLDGNVPEDALRTALLQLRRVHPLLAVRVDLDVGDRGSFTTREVPDIPVTVLSQAGPEDRVSRVAEELREPWVLREGPLVRLTMLQGQGTTELLVSAHHSVCDGRSLAYLLRDLATLLGRPDEATTGPLVPPAVERVLPSGVVSEGLLSRLMMAVLNRRWRTRTFNFGQAEYERMHRRFWKDRVVHVQPWEIQPPLPAGIAARCRQEGVSFNSALYAAGLAADEQLFGSHTQDENNVVIPVDLRERLARPVGEAFGYYASAVILRRPKLSGTFWERARAFERAVSAQLNDREVFASRRLRRLDTGLLDAIPFAMFGELEDPLVLRLAERAAGRLRTPLMVSNLGRLDFPTEFGPYRLTALRPPAVLGGSADKVLEVLTLEGRFYGTLTFNPARLRPEQATGLLASIADRLERAAGR